jgi:hypothetical protein
VGLTKEDVPNIDAVGIEISSSDKWEYPITDFCLRAIELTPDP